MASVAEPRVETSEPAPNDGGVGAGFGALDTFPRRHLGSNEKETAALLGRLGLEDVGRLIDQTVPAAIRLGRALALAAPASPGGAEEIGERDLLATLRGILAKNQIHRSFLGLGYYGCLTPGVIQRNILENPGWYTQYTPYQAEIAQGRLEALLNFQTMVTRSDRRWRSPTPRCSTRAPPRPRRCTMCATPLARERPRKNTFFVSADDATRRRIAVVSTQRGRAARVIVHHAWANPHAGSRSGPTFPTCFGVLLQYPATDGRVHDYSAPGGTQAHAAGALGSWSPTDLLALHAAAPAGRIRRRCGDRQRPSASACRFGYGGPHAAFFATRDEFKRQMPGRLIGVSKDADGQGRRCASPSRRVSNTSAARRPPATSARRRCCSPSWPAMYAVYHGPEGLRQIASRCPPLDGVCSPAR